MIPNLDFVVIVPQSDNRVVRGKVGSDVFDEVFCRVEVNYTLDSLYFVYVVEKFEVINFFLCCVEFHLFAPSSLLLL